MVFGTQMQATARALETSRVLRMEPRQYHALAAASPEFQAGVGSLAAERLGGLQGITAQTPKPQVVVVGNRWDPASHDLKRFLSRNQILYEWLTLDDARHRRPLAGRAPGRGPVPGAAPRRRHHPLPPRHPRRSPRRSASAPPPAPATTTPSSSAPAPPASPPPSTAPPRACSTLVVEGEAPGGQAETSSRIENYLGFPNGISGDELGSRALRQARRLGAEILITRKAMQRRPGGAHHPPRRRRDDPRPHHHHRHRGELAPARPRRLRPADRQGHLLRRRPQRGRRHPGRGRLPHRRRQLRRPGGDLLRQPRAERHPRGARRLAREVDVAVPDRPDRRQVEHPRRAPLRGRRRPRRRPPQRHRHPRPRHRRHPPRALRRPLRLHRRRRRDRLAAPTPWSATPAASC